MFYQSTTIPFHLQNSYSTLNEKLFLVRNIVPKGKTIVMMSIEEYSALQETLHLSKSKANRERLEQAIDNINSKTNLLNKTLSICTL
jgi:PHD/YefM family antitoxin component YafN of YafNO toxin-antitoxin module